jgi:hypothetical protein
MRGARQIVAEAKFELRGCKHTTLREMGNEPETSMVLGLFWDTQDVPSVGVPELDLLRNIGPSKGLRDQLRLIEELKKRYLGQLAQRPGRGEGIRRCRANCK